MYGRAGLERFKKAQSLEPFSVAANSDITTTGQALPKTVDYVSIQYSQSQDHDKQKQQQNRIHVQQKSGLVVPEAAPLVSRCCSLKSVEGSQLGSRLIGRSSQDPACTF